MHELCGPRSLFNQTRNHIIFCMQALGHLWYGTWRNFTAECRPSSLQRSPRMSSGGCRRTGGTSSSMPSKWPLLLFKCERGAYIDTTLQVRASAGGRCPHQQLGCQARVGCASKATGQAADKRVGLACPHVHVVGARWACLWGGYPLQRWHQPHFRVAGRNHKVSDCMRGCCAVFHCLRFCVQGLGHAVWRVQEHFQRTHGKSDQRGRKRRWPNHRVWLRRQNCAVSCFKFTSKLHLLK